MSMSPCSKSRPRASIIESRCWFLELRRQLPGTVPRSQSTLLVRDREPPVSQLIPHTDTGEIPLYHRSGDKPLDPTTLPSFVLLALRLKIGHRPHKHLRFHGTSDRACVSHSVCKAGPSEPPRALGKSGAGSEGNTGAEAWWCICQV